MAEMRRYKREVQDTRQIRRLLEECQVLRIGTMDQEGMFIVPVSYGYEYEEDGSLRFYIHSAGEGRKVQAFRQQERVAVELDCADGLIRGDYTCQYSMAFRSLMGSGKICLLSGPEKLRGLKLLMRHTAPESRISFSDEMVEAVHVYAIRMEEFRVKMREPGRTASCCPPEPADIQHNKKEFETHEI
ncbi:MAG TPA: pyridoxamine 5'-phosphate oxidase family protein [Candidatus Pullilachnospira stercoravium]|uniref:Pyridoxamine 5'-phosphate oxidase family protein n=1 Tax=Candidatus Pullilachnospira stercoravium TaxID=2840913 RepID=A0A9D1NWW2_9FIRM|nr:pyridoxamine 5'-phosphate oxidase family protein [Candidatus Pullilachnospira stercoravium]